MVVVSEGQDKYWSEEDKIVFKNILNAANGIIYVYDEYIIEAMLKKDSCIVDMS